jgi:hypothetical protein
MNLDQRQDRRLEFRRGVVPEDNQGAATRISEQQNRVMNGQEQPHPVNGDPEKPVVKLHFVFNKIFYLDSYLLPRLGREHSIWIVRERKTPLLEDTMLDDQAKCTPVRWVASCKVSRRDGTAAKAFDLVGFFVGMRFQFLQSSRPSRTTSRPKPPFVN